MSHSIEILVRPDGQTQVMTHGFAGSSCRQASRFVEQALGQVTQERLTAEFHQQQAADSSLREKVR